MTSKNEQYKTCDIKLTTLCSKEKILLQKDKKTNTFYIAFECENPKINNKTALAKVCDRHQQYTHNEFGQHQYPRHRFFKACTDVFKADGRSVPIFSDCRRAV